MCVDADFPADPQALSKSPATMSAKPSGSLAHSCRRSTRCWNSRSSRKPNAVTRSLSNGGSPTSARAALSEVPLGDLRSNDQVSRHVASAPLSPRRGNRLDDPPYLHRSREDLFRRDNHVKVRERVIEIIKVGTRPVAGPVVGFGSWSDPDPYAAADPDPPPGTRVLPVTTPERATAGRASTASTPASNARS